MLCDRCHKNEAVINYTEISGGTKRELHLCEECAARETGIGHLVSLADSSFLANLLSGSAGFSKNSGQEENLKKTNIVCPTCHMTYNEFMEYGTFGCPDCYRTFNFVLDNYLNRLQSSCEHTGKEPVYGGETVKIKPLSADGDDDKAKQAADSKDVIITVDEGSSDEELKAALNRAIAMEEYEEAARIRDILRGKSGRRGGSEKDA